MYSAGEAPASPVAKHSLLVGSTCKIVSTLTHSLNRSHGLLVGSTCKVVSTLTHSLNRSLGLLVMATC